MLENANSPIIVELQISKNFGAHLNDFMLHKTVKTKPKMSRKDDT